jgi:hypothetical protein
VYVFAPSADADDIPERPTKRRRTSNVKAKANTLGKKTAFQFCPLLHGLEGPECSKQRLELFDRYWAITEERIQVLNALDKRDTELSKLYSLFLVKQMKKHWLK